jgi:alkylated DNA repair dioxygenase AlkB
MGWHSDDEPELGAAPLIASLSLGASRRFLLRARDGSTRSTTLMLTHGSLLLMGGACQHLYRHAVPRTRAAVAARLNLTFRWVQPCD